MKPRVFGNAKIYGNAELVHGPQVFGDAENL